MRRLLTLLGTVAVFTACEQHSSTGVAMSSPDPAQFLLASPDPAFRLSDAERAVLPPLIDPSALESFLARVRPEHRATFLSDLSEIGVDGPVAFGQMTTMIPDADLRAAVAPIFRLPRRDTDRQP